MANIDVPSGGLQLVAGLRDELVLKAHRMASDTRACFDELEQQWQLLQSRLGRGAVAASQLASLHSGYEFVRDSLEA